MKKLAYRKAYADAYAFAMKKLAEDEDFGGLMERDEEGGLREVGVLEKRAWMGDEPFFNPMQSMGGGGPGGMIEDPLVRARQTQMGEALRAPVQVQPTPAPTPTPTPEAPHASAPAPEAPHASALGGAAHAQTPPAKTPKAPKKGLLKSLGGKLGLLATVGLPIASFIGGQVSGDNPTPEEEGYVGPQYM